jgi:pyrimidine-nucleoside phosphorylase
MRAYDLIFKKRGGGVLSTEEIEFFVRGFTKGEIPDYQASALLMAVYFRGMDGRETADLTRLMAESGASLDLSSVPGIKVDKHSTGGVGDGISLVLAPLAAACGVPVPMMSGRGLGHTGGTLDKLEAIPGFRVGLSAPEFVKNLKAIGVAMMGQTPEIAPADRKLYALRDVTATVENLSLITASILSKKLAEGCDALVLDVKWGSGAFMADKKSAAALARSMVRIGKRCKRRVVALLTDMNDPLGAAVGNALEVEQAVEILQGKETPLTRDFIALTEVLGGWMLFLGGKAGSSKEGAVKIRKARLDGSGLRKFKEMVALQGGDPAVAERPRQVLPQARCSKTVASPWKGTVGSMQSRVIGTASMVLGAGRSTHDAKIDPSAGIVLFKKTGDAVERGEPLAELRASDEKKIAEAEGLFLSAVRIGKLRPRPRPLVGSVIR